MKKPKTPDEWRAAVDAAHVVLCLETARRYDLTTPEQCQALLSAGKRLGYLPQHQSFELFIHALAKNLS